MILWAMESLPFIDLLYRQADTKFNVHLQDLIFISLEEHEKDYQITQALKEIFSPSITVILIPKVTRGAAETVLSAKKYIDPSDDFLVSDCDHFFDGTNLYHSILKRDDDIAGIIPVFQAPDKEPKWSYTLFDKKKNALAVGEKDAVLANKGAYANIGAYYFSKGKIFIDDAEKMIVENDMYGNPGKEEFYIAPLYERLIKKGMKIKASIIPEVWGLGTPKDVESFIKNYNSATS